MIPSLLRKYGPLVLLTASLSQPALAQGTPFRRFETQPETIEQKPAVIAETEVIDPASLQLRVLDLRDLLPGLTGSDRDALGHQAMQGRHERIADFLARFCSPRLGRVEDIKAVGGSHLAVLGRPKVHSWVEQTLRRAESSAKALYSIEARICSIDQGEIPAVCGPLEGVTGGQDLVARMSGQSESFGGRKVRLLVDKATAGQALVQRLMEASDAEMVSAPRVQVHGLQMAEVEIVEQTSFIKDFNVHRVGETVVADPIVDVIKDGVTIEALAAPMDGDRVALGTTVEIVDLLQISDFTTKLPSLEHEVTVQLPQMTTVRFQQDLVLPRHQMAVLGVPDGTRYVLVMLTVETVR